MSWQRHRGGRCPARPDSLVRFRIRVSPRTRATEPAPVPAGKLRWDHNGGPGDITWFEEVAA